MIIKSFIKKDLGLSPVDVEMALVPGLPQITVVGLPDKMIQEGTKRVQTALLSQGFQMPRAKQVLVNLNPSEMRKTSLGLDLPMALGILALTGQREDIGDGDIVYGKLSLSGDVFAPEDIENLSPISGCVITGGPIKNYSFPTKILKNLKDEGSFGDAVVEARQWLRPPFPVESFSAPIAELLAVMATGEHSVILAGPPGGGKSTFTDTVSALIAEPEEGLAQDILRNARFFGLSSSASTLWRPVVSPHHSVSAISLIGGGVPPRPGDIVRAHGGVLILEELLEFNPQAQAALREPMERGHILVSRGLKHKAFSTRCLMLATTNLCKCGEFVPGNYNRCRCSSLQLRRYVEKLSGPFVDRFTCMILTQSWKTQDSISATAVKSYEILARCERARKFIREARGQVLPNQHLTEPELLKTPGAKDLVSLLPYCRSHRRRLALLKVARTVADLEQNHRMERRHIARAQAWAYDSFIKVQEML